MVGLSQQARIKLSVRANHIPQYLSTERITIMDDPDFNAMRRMIANALKKCNDIVLLDFIYQLVTKSNRQS